MFSSGKCNPALVVFDYRGRKYSELQTVWDDICTSETGSISDGRIDTRTDVEKT